MNNNRKLFILSFMISYLKRGMSLNDVLMSSNITEQELLVVLNEMGATYYEKIK